MKMKYFIIIVIFAAVSFSSCNLIIDKDTTAEISKVSIKPVMKLKGDAIMSLPVGSTYNEEGVDAFVGDSAVNYVIVSGNVNPNQPGFYVVTYKAENQYGWVSYAYRAVLIYSGSPYGEDIAGHYKKGFLFDSDVSKYNINGYWQMTNVWSEEGVDFPIIFADKGDGTYGIVPGDHPEKGRYGGTAVKNGNKLKFYIHLTSPDGIETNQTFDWTKQ